MSGPIAVRAILAVSGKRNVNDILFYRFQVIITQSPGSHYPRAELFDNEIGHFYQFQDLFSALFLPKIDPFNLLGKVERVEQRGLPIDEGRLLPGVISALRVLDLDHFRPQLGQHIGRQGAGEQPGEIQYGQIF